MSAAAETICPRCRGELKFDDAGEVVGCSSGCSTYLIRSSLDGLDYNDAPVAPGTPDNGATVQHRGVTPPGLASASSILDEFARDVHRAGLVGEDRNAKIVYLATTSRLLEQFRPVSVAVKGASSGGKSFTVERTLDFFPDEAYMAYTAMSDKALAYLDKSVAHRTLVIYEAAALAAFKDGIGEMLLRSLLSEGHIHYQTVTDGKPVELELAGPTGLIVTTTAKSLHPENENRLLSLAVCDTPGQTKAIMRGLAAHFMGGDPAPDVNLKPWHDLQDWLWYSGERTVVIPFAGELADKTQEAALRLRRDFGQLLALVATHAVLHQATRERNTDGRVVATLDDYAVVRDLTGDLFAEALDEAVKPETREVVALVRDLNESREEKGVGVTELAAKLGLHKGTVSRRLEVAAYGGYVANLEERRGRKARYVLGDPLPDGADLLPDPEVLQCCGVAGGEGEDPDAELERLAAKFPDLMDGADA